MPLLIPEGTADIAIELVCAGDPDPWYVTFGVAHTEEPADIGRIGLSVNTAWETAFLPILSPSVTHTGAKITMGQAGDDLRVFEPSNFLNREGGGSENKLPQNCALLCRKDTAFGGRRNKGRFFIPLIVAAGGISPVGRIENTEMIFFVSACNAFMTSLATEGLEAIPSTPMVILHRSEGVSSAPSPTPVNSLTPDGVIATQRRRLR